jgi:hypothetical protein
VALKIKGGILLKNEEETVSEEKQPKKAKQKRKGKIAQVYNLHQKGTSVKEIAEKMNLKETIVRSYIWRAANPEKYKSLVDRYFRKKKEKEKSLAKAENKPAETEKTERKHKAKSTNPLPQ